MEDLSLFSKKEFTLSSMEVAEMVEKNHNELLKDIRRYVGQLGVGKIPQSDFFTESTYRNSQNKTQPCYEVTRKGCEFIANKLTGVKGAAFTARYINKFHEMEDKLNPPKTYLEALKAYVATVEENEKLLADNNNLHTQVAVSEQIISELKPKADYTDRILQSKATVTITQIAKDYGMSGTEMNKILHKLGVQYKQTDQWLLYKKYQDLGYTHSNTVDFTRSDGTKDFKMNTKWTQKGRLFLYNLLKQNNILPMIERDCA